jgi:hypothetical protein
VDTVTFNTIRCGGGGATPSQISARVDQTAPAEIIGAIEAAAKHETDKHVESELAGLVAGLSVSDVPKVLASAEKVGSKRERNILLSMLLARWVEGDPPAALNYAQQQREGRDELVAEVVSS